MQRQQQQQQQQIVQQQQQTQQTSRVEQRVTRQQVTNEQRATSWSPGAVAHVCRPALPTLQPLPCRRANTSVTPDDNPFLSACAGQSCSTLFTHSRQLLLAPSLRRQRPQRIPTGMISVARTPVPVFYSPPRETKWVNVSRVSRTRRCAEPTPDHHGQPPRVAGLAIYGGGSGVELPRRDVTRLEPAPAHPVRDVTPPPYTSCSRRANPGSIPGEANPGSIPGEVAPGFSHVEIVPDDVTGRRIFSGISRFPPLLHSGDYPYSPHFTLCGMSRDTWARIPRYRENGSNNSTSYQMTSGPRSARPKRRASRNANFGHWRTTKTILQHSHERVVPRKRAIRILTCGLEKPRLRPKMGIVSGAPMSTPDGCELPVQDSRLAIFTLLCAVPGIPHGGISVHEPRRSRQLPQITPWPLPVTSLGVVQGCRPRTEGKRRNEGEGVSRRSSRKPRRPAASSGTIPTCKNLELSGRDPPRIEHGSPRWEARSITTTAREIFLVGGAGLGKKGGGGYREQGHRVMRGQRRTCPTRTERLRNSPALSARTRSFAGQVALKDKLQLQVRQTDIRPHCTSSAWTRESPAELSRSRVPTFKLTYDGWLQSGIVPHMRVRVNHGHDCPQVPVLCRVERCPLLVHRSQVTFRCVASRSWPCSHNIERVGCTTVGPPRPRSRSEGAMRATLTRTPSAPSLLRATCVKQPRWPPREVAGICTWKIGRRTNRRELRGQPLLQECASESQERRLPAGRSAHGLLSPVG
ncbi:hypothetical protein PR048_003497 [Dryococelus australis]|uniref:Uncharacterized protein n=1 Tax=Dryococelus australis TaxID=614101 RepID=A0ABQ9IN80_9NEOP|nr:hypothetical protein PR048_003497 [Dryococelus australis]